MLAFFRWLLIFSVAAFVVGGVLGVVFGKDFESARRVGEAAGIVIWPTVLIAAAAAAFRTKSNERRCMSAKREGPRVSDMYKQDTDPAA